MSDTAWDDYIAEVRRTQDPLRDVVNGLCKPRVTPKGLARLSGLQLRTVYSFMNGSHTLRGDHFDALQAAVEALQGGDA